MTHCQHCAQPIPSRQIEQLQAPLLGRWQALCAWEQAQNPDGVPTPLRAAMHAIVDEEPPSAQAFALATPRYGREDGQGV